MDSRLYVIVLEMPDTSPRHCVMAVATSMELADQYCSTEDPGDYEFSIVEVSVYEGNA